MLEKRYRIQAGSGLSSEYTLEELRQEAAGGAVVPSAECTADDGQTWVSVASLVSIDPATAVQPHDSSAAHASDPSDSTRTAIDSASTADGFGGTRKLKRISKGEGESKFAKRSDERKSSDKVVKPQDLIGAELAGGRAGATWLSRCWAKAAWLMCFW